MRKLSYRALAVYKEAHQKISEELFNVKKRTGNTALLSEVMHEIIKLNVHSSMGVYPPPLKEALQKFDMIRRRTSSDPSEYITASELKAVLDLLSVCLEVGIVPDSCIVLGSEPDQRAEYQRVMSILEEKQRIEGA